MSILNVNKINPVGGGSTITIAGIASVTSTVTAPSFVGAVTGNVTGNVTGDATGLSGNPSINTTGIVTATSFIPTTGQLSHRNIVVNGAMQVIQRGSSTVAGAHNSFAVDRFKFKKESTAANFNMTQSTTSPDGFSKSLKVDCTSADTSTAHNEFVMVRHSIEAQDLQQLGYGTSGAKPLVLSFYVRSSLTGTYSINCLQQDNSSKIYSRTYTINSANTWERKTISIPADTSGVINDDNGEGLQFNFNLVLGSSFKGSAVSTAWETYANDKWGSQHGINLASSTSNEWYLTGVQLEVGSVATPFEHRSYADELRRCQRYFIRIPDQNASSGYYFLAQGAGHDNNAFLCNFHFPTTMRSNPSLTTTGSLRAYNGGTVTISSIILNTSSVAGACLQIAVSSGISPKDAVSLGQNNDSDAGVQFNAEL